MPDTDLFAAVQAEFAKHRTDDEVGDVVDLSQDDASVNSAEVDAIDRSSDDEETETESSESRESDESTETTESTTTENDNKSKEDELSPEVIEALKELGAFEDPKPGQRPNRIPQPRVKKMVAKAVQKVIERQKAEHQRWIDTTHTPAITQGKNLQAQLDAIIKAEDPSRVMLWLASQNDKYRSYVNGVQPGAAQQVDDDPEPKPDHEFPDGSVGFSPKQYAEWQKWNRRQTLKEVDARQAAKDAERQRREAWTAQQQEGARTTVQRQIAQAEQTWGKLFVDDFMKGEQSEVLKFLRANEGMSFEAAVAHVMAPKSRQAAIDELNEKNEKRRAAASSSTGAASGSRIAKPQTMEDDVREALRAKGLIK